MSLTDDILTDREKREVEEIAKKTIEVEKESAKKKLVEELISEERIRYSKEIVAEVEKELPKVILKEIKPQLLDILKDKNLLENVGNELDKFIVGEGDARKTIFLCSAGRLVENSKESSYNLLVNSSTGSGKDFIVKTTLCIWGGDIVQARKRISPTAFTYWHNSKHEPEWTWDGKVVYLEDVPNNVLNSDVFKVMSSSGNSTSTITVNNKAVDVEVKGKPVMIITSASANPKTEMLRRFPTLELDETKIQTVKIMEKQAEEAATGDSLVYRPEIKEALLQLKRVKVRIPFAKHLPKLLSPDNIIMRTCFQRFLDYIKASAALHQSQRQTDMEGFVIAELQDYEIARMAILKTTSNQYMIPLTRTQKQILDAFKKLGDYWFSIPQIEDKIPTITERTLYNQLPNLVQNGFLEFKVEDVEGSKKPVKMYKHKEFNLLSLPTASELEDLIANVSNVAINPSIERNETIETKVSNNI